MSSPFEEFDYSGLEDASAMQDGTEATFKDYSDIVVDPTEGMERTGDPVADTNAEIDATAQGFRSRMRTEADRLDLVTMTDFYTTVVFPTGEHLRAFLNASGWQLYGEAGGPWFIDGRGVAKLLGIELPPDPEWPAIRRDAAYDSLGMTVEENRDIEE